MSRLSTAELERLKQSVSLVSLLESEGYKLHRQGKDYVMRCPFHQEKTPSLTAWYSVAHSSQARSAVS